MANIILPSLPTYLLAMSYVLHKIPFLLGWRPTIYKAYLSVYLTNIQFSNIDFTLQFRVDTYTFDGVTGESCVFLIIRVHFFFFITNMAYDYIVTYYSIYSGMQLQIMCCLLIFFYYRCDHHRSCYYKGSVYYALPANIYTLYYYEMLAPDLFSSA